MDTPLTSKQQRLGYLKRHAKSIVLVLVFSVVAFNVYKYGFSTAVVDADTISFVKVERKKIREQINAPAIVVSKHTEVLTSKIRGRITATLILQGEQANKEQLLFTLENRDLTRQYMNSVNEQQKADVELQQTIFDYEMKLSSVEQQRIEYKSELSVLLTIIKSQKFLNERGIVSDIELIKSIAKKELLTEMLAMSKTRKQTINRLYSALIDSKRSNVEFLSKQRDFVNNNLTELNVKAPIEGMISIDESIKVGSFVEEGTRLGLIKDLNQLQLEIHIPSAYVSQVKQGAPLAFNHGGATINTTIAHLSKGAQNGFIYAFANVDKGQLEISTDVNVSIYVSDINEQFVIKDSVKINKRNGYVAMYQLQDQDKLIHRQLKYKKSGDYLIIEDVLPGTLLVYGTGSETAELTLNGEPQ
ncbi:MAG: HlyD family efflux transporter periplasmic adaptor subunit [Alteromonadaceae bacterium]|nr:HlyD family efflux transporter periplasmic adaptor subunit [Alteromonadaceae bacterium]